MGSDNQAHVQLMTLLNVKAAHPRSGDDEETATSSKRQRFGGQLAPRAAPSAEAPAEEAHAAAPDVVPHDVVLAEDAQEDEKLDAKTDDAFYAHFGPESVALARVDPDRITWAPAEHEHVLGGALRVGVVSERSVEPAAAARPHARTWAAFTRAQRTLTPMQRELLPYLGTYTDVWHSRVTMDEHDALRSIMAMHAMSHLVKTRQRILKNNERLAKAAAAAEADDNDELPELRDQGFTRPKVLVLAPFRHTAKRWVEHLIAMSGCEQVEQKARFQKEFSLPPGAVDKLADPATAARYPADHRHTFQGNIDDNFKLGIKLTRKTLKLYSAFYEGDVIVASPLGLRLLMERERDTDYLSSLEVVIADQLDVMLMQNWDHVKYVFDALNHIPKQAHDTDFSRVRPWYLDGHAPLLRQTLLLSAFDAPEFRALFHALRNVGGKLRTTALAADAVPAMSLVTPGVRQKWHKFACANAQGEPDARFQAFATHLLPLVRKSAVSASHTMIVVPSYFDFVRLEDYFRRAEPPISYTSLTEYSSNRDVSRAREAFYSGKKNFLLLTERFHFYRRYMVRGARTVVFYAPPEHASYYAELINAPLTSRGDTKDAERPDAADLSVLALYSKYDMLRLERIVGAAQARAMVTDGRPTWHFV